MAYRGRTWPLRTLLAAALWLLIATPLANAATPQAAPLSREFRTYQQGLEDGAAAAATSASSGRDLGLIPEPMDPKRAGQSGFQGRLGLLGVSPAAYDLRAEGRVSPVKDQGSLGTCWAFATYGGVESALMPVGLFNFSEDHMVLTAGFDDGGDPYSAGGNYYMSTAYLTRWGGPVNEADDAYGDGVTPVGLSAAKHVQEVLYIAGGATATDNAAIKNALMAHGAVGTSIYWDDALYNAGENAYYYADTVQANRDNHAVVIVGWDDNFAASRFSSAPAGNGAWLVRNSWGAGWGDDGYFWVSYHDTYCGRDVVFNTAYPKTEATSNYSTIYSHDPYGQIDTLGYGDPEETAWGANIYKASKSQMITGVGFFTHVPSTTYSVYTGGVDADGTPGALSLQGSGTIDTAGFHTVKFTGSRWVAAGSKFAVAIRLTTPGSHYPLAYEAPVFGFTSSATALPKQSFIRCAPGQAWDDLTSYLADANLCLKAYGKNDTVRPTTTTVAKRVRRYARVTLSYRIEDSLPSSGAATCSIRILKSGKLVKTISLGQKTTNASLSYRWKASLGRGTYYWLVSAKDRAGNTATIRKASKLVIY